MAFLQKKRLTYPTPAGGTKLRNRPRGAGAGGSTPAGPSAQGVPSTPLPSKGQSILGEGEPLPEAAGADECACDKYAKEPRVGVHLALTSLACQRGWAQTSPVEARQFSVRRRGAASLGAPS